MSTVNTIKATLIANNLEANDNVVNLYIEMVSALDENDGDERQQGMKDLISQGFNKEVLEVTNEYVVSDDYLY